MGITTIVVVSVPVTNQDRAKAFYVDVLGFEPRRESPFGDGQRWVEVAPPAGGPSLVLVTWFPTMPAGSVTGLVLGCDDVDATYAELAARGVVFKGAVESAPWGRFATFDDPDGNGWVLQG
ncbi:MAG: VOC family protein [Chloroflexota bacterium]|nr:VOC family protein [Chloroflexota bacterium]